MSVVTRLGTCPVWLGSVPGMPQAHLLRSDITMVDHRQRGPARHSEIGVVPRAFNPGRKIIRRSESETHRRRRRCVSGSRVDVGKLVLDLAFRLVATVQPQKQHDVLGHIERGPCADDHAEEHRKHEPPDHVAAEHQQHDKC